MPVIACSTRKRCMVDQLEHQPSTGLATVGSDDCDLWEMEGAAQASCNTDNVDHGDNETGTTYKYEICKN